MGTNLSNFTDVHMKIQKLDIATGNRIKHLKKQGKTDDRAEHIHQIAVDFAEIVVGYIAEEFRNHPTYPWTSRIKGCGLEAAAKPIGIIEGVTFRDALLSDLKDAGIEITRQEYKEHRADLEIKYPWVFQRRSGIYAFDTPSRLRRFAGLAPVDGKTEKVARGQKGLHYNPELRMMLWRLLTRLLQQCDYRCPDCGKKVVKESVSCKYCGANIRDRIVEERGVWYQKYLENDDYYMRRFERDGIKVMPTQSGRFCPVCLEEKAVPLTTKNCPDCGEKLMKKEEPPGVIWRGHVVNMAKRRTIRLWLDCLWLVWREALGLPTRTPYSVEYQGHHLIDPWEMVNKLLSE